MSVQTIGRYEVERELGRGGMAIVYLARDPRIKRQVAVKVLPRQFTFDPQFRARFQREAEAIAALDHPAIVPIYDFGEHDEQPFLVMRYLPGGSLAGRLRAGPLGLPELARVFERLAEALDQAHTQGIVHRDLKPGNILFDAAGSAYLADFGIAKITTASAAFTRTGILGTPEYLSPEQAQGTRRLDGRSDIYSLGVVLFEILTGQLPYRADTPLALAMAHLSQPVPSILQVKPDLPAGWDAIIRRALAKEPARRYPTAGALAQEVSRLCALAGERRDSTVVEPVVYTPPTAPSPSPAPAPPPISTPPVGVTPYAGLPALRQVFPGAGGWIGLGTMAVFLVCVLGGLGLGVVYLRSQGILNLPPPGPAATSPLERPATETALATLVGQTQASQTAQVQAAQTRTARTAQAEAAQTQTARTAEVFATDLAAAGATRAAAEQRTAEAETLANATAAAAAHWPVVLFDSFDSIANGWCLNSFGTSEYSTTSLTVGAGKYRWRATALQSFLHYCANNNSPRVSDFFVSVEARVISGPEDAQVGLVLRRADNRNFYVFRATNSGRCTLELYYAGEWTTLLDWFGAPAFQPDQANRLSVAATGARFLLYINDQFVGEAVDGRLSNGHAGVLIGLRDAGDSAVFEFDEFELRAP